MNETISFTRYDADKHAEIKKIPGVVNIVSGKEIDIIVLEKKSWQIQSFIDQIRDQLEAIGVDVQNLGFMYEGESTILNPKETREGSARHLSFGQVGQDALIQLGVLVGDKMDTIIPPSLSGKPTYTASDIVKMNAHFRALNVNPNDVVVGAKFLITTESGSEYVLTVNEEGLFEIKDDEINLKKPHMIGAKFTEFNNTRRLVGNRANTSPVQTMVKL